MESVTEKLYRQKLPEPRKKMQTFRYDIKLMEKVEQIIIMDKAKHARTQTVTGFIHEAIEDAVDKRIRELRKYQRKLKQTKVFN